MRSIHEQSQRDRDLGTEPEGVIASDLMLELEGLVGRLHQCHTNCEQVIHSLGAGSVLANRLLTALIREELTGIADYLETLAANTSLLAPSHVPREPAARDRHALTIREAGQKLLTEGSPVRRMNTCSVCGQPFTAKRTDAHLCSQNCRSKRYRDRKKANS
jgi:ribosomal protein S14